jgi:hypothetical protein
MLRELLRFSGARASRLPKPGAHVEIVAAGRAVRIATVEAVRREIRVAGVVARSGERAVFVYTGESGRYRFVTKCVEYRDGYTTFALPRVVSHIGAAVSAQKRASVRLDLSVTGSWRAAPGGKGEGRFEGARIRDVSRGGCSVLLERAFRPGSLLEIRLPLAVGSTLDLLGVVTRCEPIEPRQVAHGLRFQGVTPAEDRAILTFINRSHAQLRGRREGP